MTDPIEFLLKRAASYLHCDHGDGLNHASFDVEKLLSEYAAAVLEEMATRADGQVEDYCTAKELRARAAQERER